MAEQTETRTTAINQLWSELDAARVGMLSVRGSDQHPQPMTLFAEQEAGVVWFITSADTDLSVAVGSGAEGQLTIVAKSQDYHASLQGQLEFSRDEKKLDELWSVPVAAWFEKGREDPTVRLLRFTPNEAAAWASDGNVILVGLKLLRAGLQDGEKAQDIGVHHVLNLKQAA